MLRNIVFILLVALGALPALQAQKIPTATRAFDIQAGGDFVYGKPDYGGSSQTLKGYGAYSTIDFRPHLGVELDFHQANGTNQIYERTYEVGGRYVKHYGRFDPYAKVMIGRGVLNFNQSEANLAYNLFALGGGADYKLKRYLNLRGDFEYQFWQSNTGLSNGLTPYIVSVGAAYHFR